MSEKPSYEELEQRIRELEAVESVLKKSEHELLKSKVRFQSLFETMNEGVVVIDPDGQIVQANPSAERILGLVRSEIMKRNYTAPDWKVLRPDGTEMPPEEMAGPRAMKDRQPIKGMVMGVEHPDGVIAWINVSAAPLVNEDGELGGIVATFTDITDHQQSKEKLKLFKTLVENSPEAIAVSDANGSLIYINPAHEKLFGRSLDEARRLNYRDYYPHESIAVLNDRVAPTLAQGKNWEGTLDVFDATGRRFPLWEHAGTILDEQGRMVYGFGIMHDETEHKKAEKELREVLENSLDVSYKRNLQTNFYEYLSPVFEKITGFKPEEIKTMPIEGVLDLMHQDDLSKIERVIADSMSGESGTSYQLEYRFRHKDGHYIWLHDKFTTVSDSEGMISARIGSVRDITERKQTEEALRESECLIKSILRSTKDIVVFKDKELIYRIVNSALCEFLGKSENELLGKTDFDIFPEELADKYRNDDKKVIKNRRAIIIDEEVSTPDGIRTVITTKAPVIKNGNEIFGIVLTARDITERVNAENKVRESEARWNFALEGARDGVWDWNVVTNQVFFSNRWKEMLGFSEDEIGSDLKEWESRVHPDDKAAVFLDLDRHFTGETSVYENEHRVLCKDSTYKWILDRGKVISWTEDGKPLRVIGTHSDISKRKDSEIEREKLVAELKEALIQVKKLSGLLPICCHCKKIRDDKGYWNQIETYIQNNSEAVFSHSICKECAKKLYPDLDIYDE